MTVWELFLIGIGLSMDAFAVSVCKGLAMPKISMRVTLTLALFFGGFQALMPVLGWLLANTFHHYISAYASWISFILLAYIGGKMGWDAIKEWRHPSDLTLDEPIIDIKDFFLLAVATSIDAFAVGVTFSLLSVNVLLAAGIIGLSTFTLSAIAVFIGHLIGAKMGVPAQLAGGIILIGLGVRILISHYI